MQPLLPPNGPVSVSYIFNLSMRRARWRMDQVFVPGGRTSATWYRVPGNGVPSHHVEAFSYDALGIRMAHAS